MNLAVLDTGPLVAVADTDDARHSECLEVLSRSDLIPVIPGMALGEASYLIGKKLGAAAEAKFLAGVAIFRVDAPMPDDLARMAELVEQYSDFPLGGTDASVVALAERLNVTKIVTLDHRHFGAIKPKHVNSFELLP
ncbi:MAG: PIN domain-containing protein [Solirubrobacterales bacterium]|nr:PIN domain-containing protein [Solirubrobacterales bacterium]